MDYQVLAYYAIVKIDDPQAEVARHKEFLTSRDFKGRIYISEQGINGQSSGRIDHANEYMAWMASDRRFQKMPFKIHAAQEHAFPKMTVKYRKQLVAIDCPVDFSQVGERVTPQEWKKMLQKRDDKTLILDVRNEYEWEIGHFEGAELPRVETFRQFPLYAKQLKEKCDPNTTVLMYCTGGIRCEFFSAVMKQEGFERVYQLDGGIIHYGEIEGNDHWQGKLFVFDDRLSVPLGAELPPISHCAHCGELNDVYYNCANMDCNQLFLSCLTCLKAHQGCCSSGCEGAERIRPYQENAKPFRKWDSSIKLRKKGDPSSSE